VGRSNTHSTLGSTKGRLRNNTNLDIIHRYWSTELVLTYIGDIDRVLMSDRVKDNGR